MTASTIFEKVRLLQITANIGPYSHSAEDRLCVQAKSNRNLLSLFLIPISFELIILSSTRVIAKYKHGVFLRSLHEKHLELNQKSVIHTSQLISVIKLIEDLMVSNVPGLYFS